MVAETAAYVVLSAVRLDAGAQAVPYVGGWAEAAAKDLTAYAVAVHRIAAELEAGRGSPTPWSSGSAFTSSGRPARVRGPRG